jgi:porin
MKRILLLGIIIILLGFNTIHAQTDTTKKNPFSFEATYLGDFFYNFSGGIKQGATFLGMANIKIGFNTEDAGLWKGGELFLNAANTHGGDPSATFIGDYQVASNIEAEDLTYVHELWLKQSFGKASFIIGLQDLCAEFISSNYAGLFLNSSCGVHSTVASNFSVPIFPLTAIGAQFHYDFSPRFSLKVAAFDGVPDDFSFNKHNLKWDLKKEEGYLLFTQLSHHNTNATKPGTYKLGFYYHNPYTITTQDEDGLITSEKYSENYGLYLIIDQIIYKSQSGKSLAFFLQSSVSPKWINENWYFVGGGLHLTGMFSKRMDDELGIAVAHAGINNALGSETTLEISYKAPFGDHFFLQPDFQYIINPAGTEKILDNSFVGFIRLGLSF